MDELIWGGLGNLWFLQVNTKYLRRMRFKWVVEQVKTDIVLS